jgi:hypothetical protein
VQLAALVVGPPLVHANPYGRDAEPGADAVRDPLRTDLHSTTLPVGSTVTSSSTV